MSDVLAKITSHFESLGVRTIHVPEWDATFYSTPVTVAERQRIFAGTKGENDYELCIRVLLEKARDAEGKKVFTLADKPALLQKADSAVVIRVAAEILSGGPDAGELKNS